MNTLGQDLRYAVRFLFKQPGFTAVAVLTLALAMGANTAIFSVSRAVLLDPLPYPDSGRLVMVWEDASRVGFPENTPAPGNYADWKSQNTVFEGMAALRNRSFSLTGDGQPERLQGRLVTHDLFTVLGVAPLIGRAFWPEDDRPGAAKVAVISHGLWQTRYAGANEILGRKILLDGEPHTVVGVMPPGFDFPEKGTQVWTPIALGAEQSSNRRAHYLRVVARLKPGVTLEGARRNMDAIARRLEQDHPETNAGIGARVNPLRDQLIGNTRTALVLLLVIVGCVLVIASANLANLLLARAVSRQKELAVRIALGAGRLRLVRQMLTESLLLSAAGAGLGLLVALWGLDFLAILIPVDLTSARIQMDAGLMLFAAALCSITALLFGLLPSGHAWRLAVAESLSAGNRSGEHRSAQRLRAGLVVAQTAFAVFLLVGAGLMLRTFVNITSIDPGFRGESVLTMRTALPVPRYSDRARRAAFYSEVLDRVQALPGVTHAGFTSWLPYTNWGGTSSFEIEGRPAPPPSRPNDANIRLVTPGYLPAMGMKLLSGRLLQPADREGAEPVAVINQTMMRKFFASEEALNLRFRICGQCPWLRIVGVVADIRQKALDVEARPEYFVPLQQLPQAIPFAPPQDLAIRAAGDPITLASAVRRAVWEVDPQQPVAQVRRLSDYLEEDLAPRRFQTRLTAGFAGLALLLASLGIYGVISYSVARRRQEIGVRIALGARPGDVVRLVISQGLRPALAGLGIGLVGAWAVSHLIAGLLHGVRPRDPLTFGAAAVALLAVALLACWLPARRAGRLNPTTALRYE